MDGGGCWRLLSPIMVDWECGADGFEVALTACTTRIYSKCFVTLFLLPV